MTGQRHAAEKNGEVNVTAQTSASDLYNLSKRDDGAVGRGVRSGRRAERWESLSRVPSDGEHMMSKSVPGKRHQSRSHDHQRITH